MNFPGFGCSSTVLYFSFFTTQPLSPSAAICGQNYPLSSAPAASQKLCFTLKMGTRLLCKSIASKTKGTDSSEVCNQLHDWFIWKPNSRPPPRPRRCQFTCSLPGPKASPLSPCFVHARRQPPLPLARAHVGGGQSEALAICGLSWEIIVKWVSLFADVHCWNLSLDNKWGSTAGAQCTRCLAVLTSKNNNAVTSCRTTAEQ